ncbi:TRAP transporter small permease subunit [Desulfobacula phenolica]|uniref:TRAP-type mannitol/chloroaromatic compound transport system, small permease component n=1 Tax=Desulfobacula phenolica TaxID=90732 RepID=A0A1H2GGU9_9BACT|nr:TRAP transporter small permease [Desulfobacula phenolica]SDU18774.1 TRAP-type mannitol/chloroaromatic compound transport system, small permease component [Desulfobacula phenolica]
MKIVNKMFGSAGGILIGAMMLLVVAEVSNRLFWGSSIEGAIEIEGIFLALAIFLGFSPCEEEKKHVRVELVAARLPKKLKTFLDIIVYITAVGVVAVITWQVGLDMISSWSIRETLPGAKVQVPVYPAKAAAFIGYFAFFIQLMVSLASIIRTQRRSESQTMRPSKKRNL